MFDVKAWARHKGEKDGSDVRFCKNSESKTRGNATRLYLCWVPLYGIHYLLLNFPLKNSHILQVLHYWIDLVKGINLDIVVTFVTLIIHNPVFPES